MSQSPPPTPEALLQSGLTALKQGTPHQAVALFSQLQDQPKATGRQKLKARMGLVRAYRALGQVTAAKTLCERLRQVSQPQVQQWAERTLAELTATESSSHPDQNTDPTGFRPLSSSTTDNASGFVPFTNGDTTPATPAAKPPASPPNSVTSPPENQSESPPLATPPSAQPNSLFHYQSLNQDPSSTATPAAPKPPHLDAPSPEVNAPSASPAVITPPAELEQPADQPWQFCQAGRLERLRKLPGQPPWWQLGLIQAITLVLLAVVLFQVVAVGLQVLIWLTVGIRWLFPALPRFAVLYRDYHEWIVGFLGLLLLGSPWTLDGLFTRAYGQKPLSVSNLRTRSPESARLLLRICQQQGWTIPALRIIPNSAPILFSYGWLPRNSRIVVSQGLLDSLEDDELASLYGYELSHLVTWTLPLMSLVGLLLQGVYQGYWQSAKWGDRQVSPLKAIGATASVVCYGIYWLLRKVSLLMVRQRATTADRCAVEWTGNPNGLTRALLKSTMAMAEEIATAEYTPPLLESTDLLTPLSYQTVFSMGSLYPQADLPSLLAWDSQNPYRHWLNLNHPNPLLGERLTTLARYATEWKLDLEIPTLATAQRTQGRLPRLYWGALLRQISPYIGPLLGLAIALVIWFIGGLVNPLGVWWVSWVYGDRSLLIGGALLGAGIGTLVRINTYFPDIVQANRQDNPDLGALLADNAALPTDSIALKLQGTLLGRHGIANWLCQDFLLKTPDGLVKLHFLSTLGALGNALIHPGHPVETMGQPVVLLGWFRRSATPWIDIDRLIRPGKQPIQANHPIWSAALGLGFCLWGIVVILRGG
jgi:Zn-dependent protease with chaperone function